MKDRVLKLSSNLMNFSASESLDVLNEFYFLTYSPRPPPRLMYDPVLSTFTSVDIKRLTLAAAQEPPNNCPACLLNEQRDHEKETRELKDEHGNKHGVAFAGVDYHLEDFVLYRAEIGPANIGYVIKIQVANETLTVRKVGRISSLQDGILPNHIVRDEVGFLFPDAVHFA